MALLFVKMASWESSLHLKRKETFLVGILGARWKQRRKALNVGLCDRTESPFEPPTEWEFCTNNKVSRCRCVYPAPPLSPPFFISSVPPPFPTLILQSAKVKAKPIRGRGLQNYPLGFFWSFLMLTSRYSTFCAGTKNPFHLKWKNLLEFVVVEPLLSKDGWGNILSIYCSFLPQDNVLLLKVSLTWV